MPERSRAHTAPRSLPFDKLTGRRYLVGFGVVTLIAILHAAHDLKHGYDLWIAVTTAALIVGQCVVLTFGHSWASRRNAWRRSVMVVGTLVSAAFGLLFVLPHSTEWHWSMTAVVVAGVALGVSITGLWALVFQLPLLIYQSRLHALEAEGLHHEAELLRLRVHLHPHFLLNTLNAIAGLVTEDAAEARRLIAALGDLVRDAHSDSDELRPFADEVAWLRHYADILESRHRGHLSFRWELAEETMTALVPRLLIQPLVENAVEHGALRKREGGSVSVSSEVTAGGAIRFVIEDDGPGFDLEAAEGLGLSLVRRRVALLCPGGSVRFDPCDTGTRVIVEIPRSPEESA